jgi:hypothetical protein
MKNLFKIQANRLLTLSAMLVMALGMVIIAACKKDPTPVVTPVDPNLGSYVVSGVRVLTTKGDTLKSIVSISKVSETEGTIDAVVPDDGNPGKRFKIDFVYPTGTKPTSVAPSTADSIDFSIAKTFTFVFTDKVTKKYTLNIIEQAPQEPLIETFVITGAQQTVIDQSKQVIDVRLAQGANVSAITPTITVSPNTATIVNGGATFNFSTNQTITVKNGALTKAYLVRVTDYGFTKTTVLGDFSLAANKRPTSLTSTESSIALDADGSNAFVSSSAGILKYNLATPTAAPTNVNMVITGTTLAPTKILQTADGILFSGNNPWAAGNIEICAWVNGTSSAPVRVINAAIPAGSIFQNFHVAKSGSNFIFTFVNREPLRRSPKADPTAYIVTVPAASVTAGTPVTSLPAPQTFVGMAATAIGDGPNMELVPIPNSTDYFYNSGTISPTLVSPTLGSPVYFSTALVNGSSIGLKAFEHNRGKYLMYGVFTWSDNLANPKASKFVLFDVTKKGYKQTILDVNSEFATTPISYATWNGIQKMDVGLGGKAPTADYYCQTAFATTASGKLRVAVLSENNGFMVFECD